MIRRKTGKFMTVLLGAALLGTAAFASGCSSAQPDSQEDGTVVAHVGENPVYLDEAEFYTRMLQEQWEAAYYQSFGSKMWQAEATEDGQTLEQVLKSDVMSLLTELHLLCAHAEEYGVELTEEEQAVIAERAENFMESNTPEVLEAAGATAERVERYLTRNELAGKTAEQIQSSYEPEIDEEAARVGKLTYCLFSVTGT